ncbi:MAG TPA: thioredoxin domain-containing protein [Allosphingosinicella sp.]|nr:thioredoxin domain-containing protein [Allosphingosinicella sp.]
MRRPLLATFAALAAITALAGPATDAAAQRRAAAVQDWTRVAARTPEGGFRIGSPDARIKLVEYLSTTCGHCAAFSRESAARLIPVHVRSGRVSVEYRNYYLNGLDVAAALLSRCASPAGYFAMTHELLATQATWTARIQSVPAARRPQLQAMAPLQLTGELITILGLDAVGQRHGIGPAARRQCLTQANLDRLEQLHDQGARAGVQGTPTFFINGAIQNVNTWAEIEPRLQ